MTLLVVGLSHRTAPLEVLESAGLTSAAAERLASELVGVDSVAEALVLLTCNRVEVIAEVSRFHPAVASATDLLAKLSGVPRSALSDHLYVHFDSAATSHVFEVASGLDSMVVGESQIRGQLRSALIAGQEQGTAGRSLNAVLQRALRVGKRVQSETGIDRSGVSVVSVALDAAEAARGTLAGSSVLVVGAGSMGSLALAGLAERGVTDVTVASRTLDRASAAAAATAARVVGLDELDAQLAACDVAVFATGALGAVVDAERLGRLREGAEVELAGIQQRRMGPALARVAEASGTAPRASGTPARASTGHLLLLDLAVPHDVDPDVTNLPGVTRIDLADVAAMPSAAGSRAQMDTARAIVAEEVGAFTEELAGQQVEPVLVSLRNHAGEVLDAEMRRLRMRLGGVEDAALMEVERAMRRAMATLLHNPTVRMKQLAAQPGGDRYAEALSALFDLDPAIPNSVTEASGGAGAAASDARGSLAPDNQTGGSR